MDPRSPGLRGRPTWMRFAGVGIEFAAAMAGLALVGYWVDRHYRTSPWGVIVGAVLGLIGGTYNLIHDSMRAFKQIERESRENHDHGDAD